MPWLSRFFSPSDKLHADDLNNLHLDQITWGGDVNGGGYTLSNVHIVEAGAQAGGGGVTSWNARNGDVVPLAGDYTAAMVSAVPLSRQIITGPSSGLSGGGPLSGDLTLTAAVTSVFGRTGAVVLTPADITAATGVLGTRKINTAAGSGLTGGGQLSADLNLSVVADSSNQQIQVMSQGSPIGSPRHAINFISGSGALVTVSEITASNRIDVTVASTGTGGFVDPTQILGDLIVRGVSAPATRLAVGTDGQVLTADHLQTLGVKWATPAAGNAVTSVFGRTGAVVATASDGYTAAMILNAVDQTGNYNNPPWIASLPWSKITNPPAFMLDPTAAKGDLIVHGATGTTSLPAGGDGSVLTVDSTMARGVKWGALPVTSVFGRSGGAIVAAGGDYTVAQVTGAVPNTTTINTSVGSGLQGGGNLSGNLSLSVVPDTTNQRVQILLAGAAVGLPRPKLNFTSGAGVALSITDNSASNWVDITVASSGTGGGGGMVDPTSHAGDLIVRNANLPNPPVALPIGANGQVLTVDLAQASGMKWAAPTGGGAGSQSPWVANVDAAAFNLNNVGGIGVNIASNKTVARVLAFVNASEDGFRATTSSAAGVAGASCLNDLGNAVSIRSYGSGFVGPLPGLATLEATTALAFLSNTVEIMRLNAGHVLIGTTTDDGLNAVQVNGKVKSLAGGFVFPDNSVQTTAYTAGSSPVTSVFGRTGAVVAKLTAPFDYSAANVTNAVDSSSTYNNPSWITSLAWSKITGAPALLVDPTTTLGDLMVRGAAAPATRLGVGTNGQVLTADSSQALGVKWGASPGQSPWTSDIDAASHNLNNLAGIGFGAAASAGYQIWGISPTSIKMQTQAQGTDATNQFWMSNDVGDAFFLRLFSSAHSTTAMRHQSQIYASQDLTVYTGSFERLRLTAAGNLGVGSAAPVTALDVRTPAATYAGIHLRNDPTADNGLYLSGYSANGSAIGAGIGSDTNSHWIAKATAWTMISQSGSTISFVAQPTDTVGAIATFPATTMSVVGPQVGFGTFTIGNVFSGVYAQPLVMMSQSDAATGSTNSKGPLVLVNPDPTVGNSTSILFATTATDGTTKGNAQIAAVFTAARTTGYCPTDLAFNTAAGSGPVERMRITAAGNVGIGRIPETMLDVAGTGLFRPITLQAPTGKGLRLGMDASGNSDIACYDWGAGATFLPLAIRGSPTTFNVGSVGISTATPGCLLSLGSGVTARKFALYDDGTNFYSQGVESGFMRFDVGSSGGYKFNSNPAFAPVMWIGNNGGGTGFGSVGINVSAGPPDILTIGCVPYSAMQTGGIRLQSTSGEWIFRLVIMSDGGGIPRFAIINKSAVEALTIGDGSGYIKLKMPQANPGTSGSLWCDPADGYRVEWIP